MEKDLYNSGDCDTTVIGAGPYGLSSAAYLRASGIETRVFGDPMSFWATRMPRGMYLRSNLGACHIADPNHALTLDSYCCQSGEPCPKPVPLDLFIRYGQWYQRQAVPDLDCRRVRQVDADARGFRITLSDGETFLSRRVVLATGIDNFSSRPPQLDGIPSELASHSSEHNDLTKFKGKRVAVIGAGQSAFESAALFKEADVEVEVIARQRTLNWVGQHPRLHHLGPVSRLLYSKRDVGPAGISRLVAAPHLFRRLPRRWQDRTAHRAIRPAVASWLQPRLAGIPVLLGRHIVSATIAGAQLRLKLDNGMERVVDHVLLATGFRVDVARCRILSPLLLSRLEAVNGYPVLGCGFECSIPGLHFLGKTAAWSFGPILGFVSGTEFAANELVRSIGRKPGRNRAGN